MRGVWAILALGMLAAGWTPDAARAEAFYPEVRYRVSVDGSAMGHEIDDTVIFLRVASRDAAKPYWVVERRVKERMIARVLQDAHRWIDGRDCPTVERMLREVASLPPLALVKPDVDYWSPPPSDVPRTRFAGPAMVQDKSWAGVEAIRSDYFGPVAGWWNRGQKRLEGCWRDAPVMTSEGPIPAYLTTPEQVRWMKP